MLKADRLKERMALVGLTQSELARRIGVTQPTIYRLFHGKVAGSSHLHRIARELGTSPAYLEGETDDPDKDAPPPAAPPSVQFIRMDVALPAERALAQMFEGLLECVDLSAPLVELAQELAELLPTALSAVRGRPLSRTTAFPDETAEALPALASVDREPT